MPWRSPVVRVVFAATALAPLGVPLISPALPVVRDAFALTDAEASLLVSAYFVTGIVLSPFIGLVADRVGRRRVLVASLFGFSLAGAAIAFAPNFDVVLAIRLVQGTAAAGIFIATVTLVGDAFDGVRRNAVLGVNTAVLSAGAAVYPVVGGYLATISWRAPFFAYVAGLPVAAFAWYALEETATDRAGNGPAYLRRVVGALARREAVLPYGATFLTELLLFGVLLTVLPYLFAERYEPSPVLTGLVIAAVEAASAAVAASNGRLARRFSDARLITLGFACYAAGLAGAWLASSLAVVAAGMVVFGAGVGLALPSVDALLSGLVEREYRAGALSLRNSTTFLGRAVGPFLFARVGLATGYRTLLLAAAVLSLAAGAGALALGRSKSS